MIPLVVADIKNIILGIPTLEKSVKKLLSKISA